MKLMMPLPVTLIPAPPLKGYCTVFQHALESLEITGNVLS